MMFISAKSIRRTFAFALTLGAIAAQAATPLSDLYSAVPKPPASAAEALTWLSDGEIVYPKYLEVATALAAERARIAELNGGKAPEASVTPPASIADSAEVQAAARNYANYLAKNQGAEAPAAVLSKRKRWLQAAFGQNQMQIAKAMTPCDTPCTDEAAIEANKSLINRRDYELKTEIRAWNAMFDDWKTKRFSAVIPADSSIGPTAGGTAATTAEGRSVLASYQAAILDEIELLLSIPKLCVLRAEAIMNGLDGSEPDGISGATKKAAK
jgi:hypothetical protein